MDSDFRVQSEMKELDKDVYVAHFDMLGMGSAIKRDSWKAWQNILDLSEALDCQELPIVDNERQRLSERYFSDTVLITSEDDSESSLHSVLARSLELFRCALRRSIPLRGGVAHGTWFEKKHDNKDLFSGSSLHSAYELGESQKLLGISVCSTTYERFYDRNAKPFSLKSGKDVILKKSIPVKGGSMEPRYILNWPAICDAELNQIRLDDVSAFSQHFWTVNQNIELERDVLVKYENTLNLINEIT